MKGERHGAENVQDEARREAWREGARRLQGERRMAPKQAVRRARALVLAVLGVALLVAVTSAQVVGVLTNVTVQWDPSPAAENVTSYTVTVDGNAITQAATCTATVCQVGVNGLQLGAHTVTVAAVNEWGTSSPTTATFTITVPTQVKNVKAKKS